MTATLEPPLHAALAEIFDAAPGVSAAAVFGSVASGRARPDSDIDLYVRLEPGRVWGPEERRRVEADVARAADREPHLVVEEPGRTSVILRREVARTGALVWEARPGAWAELKAAASLAYADLEPWIRRCEAGVRCRILRDLAPSPGGPDGAS